LEDCASALAYAYARGLTHRDVKLTNILIHSTGSAKLVDFGLAQFFASLKIVGKEKVERTVDYAGLERATGVQLGDVRSDIFFLGCVLYEMLTGRPPMVTTRDKHARMRKSRFDEVQPLRRGEVDAPASVFQLAETMTALKPSQRYQTPAQLLDAIKACRREVEGKAAAGSASASASSSRSLFVVEKDERLQDAMRERFKDLGYRVLIAADPTRALDRFRRQPFDALIVDARTTGEDGRIVYEQVISEAGRKQIPCAGILILAEDQDHWAKKAPNGVASAVLVDRREAPVTMKQLYRKLNELVVS
jgi:CheY-like chemotaxis protein